MVATLRPTPTVLVGGLQGLRTATTLVASVLFPTEVTPPARVVRPVVASPTVTATTVAVRPYRPDGRLVPRHGLLARRAAMTVGVFGTARPGRPHLGTAIRAWAASRRAATLAMGLPVTDPTPFARRVPAFPVAALDTPMAKALGTTSLGAHLIPCPFHLGWQ